MAVTNVLGDVAIGLAASFATTYLIALGHSVFEKAGMLDLAIDGVFFMSTGVAVAGALLSNSPLVGSIAAAVAAGLVGLLMAIAMTALPISHGALGLSFMFVGYGIGIMIGYPVRRAVGNISAFSYPPTAIYYVAAVAAALAIGILIELMLSKTKLGAAIRACGESPHAAMALGVDVMKIRALAGFLGFAILGLGASLFPLLWYHYWDIKSYLLGFGWLAFTVALSAGRHPLVLMPLSLLFGGLFNYYIRLGALFGISADLAKAIPFAFALIAMLAYSKTSLGRTLLPPASLGKIFYREERTI
ncbi:MAG: ribose ABC transporter permease [Desulfurococcaceae archaeon]